MTEQKKPSDSDQEKKYVNYPEQFTETSDGGVFGMIFLLIWYMILGVAGLALLGFVALFVACMV